MLNKRQRLSHYKKALDNIITEESDFICCALGNINDEFSNILDDNAIETYMQNNYPELLSLKPKKAIIGQAWWEWMGKRGKNTRINVLNKCIEMCKPKKK